MSRAGWKNATHPMNRMVNWCIGGCWFTLVGKLIAHKDSDPPAHFRVFGSCKGNLSGPSGPLCSCGPLVCYYCCHCCFLSGGGGERKREREREKKGGTRWTLKLCISLSQVDNTFMVRHLDEMGLRVAHFAGCSWFGFSKGLHFAGFCWYVFFQRVPLWWFCLASLSLPLSEWVFVL